MGEKSRKARLYAREAAAIAALPRKHAPSHPWYRGHPNNGMVIKASAMAMVRGATIRGG